MVRLLTTLQASSKPPPPPPPSFSNLYSAGSRDSELTNHGYLQATRLGEHFQSSAVQFTHIFSSQLKRAVKTAKLIRDAQPTSIDIRQVRSIMEQDFGFYEGKPVSVRSTKGGNVLAKDEHRTFHKDDPGFVDVESKESMALRVDAFLDVHLLPILGEEHVVAVVSHGIILSVLWRRFLQRLPVKGVTIHSEVVAMHGHLDLERLGGWSNTGFLELEMHRLATPPMSSPLPTSLDNVLEASLPEKETLPTVLPGLGDSVDLSSLPEKEVRRGSSFVSPSRPAKIGSTTNTFTNWTTTIRAVNHKPHLTNLKRTRGGVGSSPHDEKQKSIHSFFKKEKKE
jgi:broad specificity phosphatase PhoE